MCLAASNQINLNCDCSLSQQKTKDRTHGQCHYAATGETVADGTVTKWFKKVGDVVVKGEPLFEVSTDKVDTEIPSPTNGVLTAILVDEGVTVDVGTVLAVIGDGSDETTSSAPEPVASSPRERPKEDATVHARANRSTSEESQLSPVVRRLLEENDLDVTTITGRDRMVASLVKTFSRSLNRRRRRRSKSPGHCRRLCAD